MSTVFVLIRGVPKRVSCGQKRYADESSTYCNHLSGNRKIVSKRYRSKFDSKHTILVRWGLEKRLTIGLKKIFSMIFNDKEKLIIFLLHDYKIACKN